MYKKIILTTFLGMIMAAVSFPQIHSVNAFIDYSAPFSKRLSVTEIDGVGGGAEVRINVYDKLQVKVSGGYQLYSLKQDNAIKQWNWRFYNERYIGIVKSDTTSDKSLSATLEPFQKMDAMPLVVSVGYELNPVENLFIRPSAGGGIIFFTRRLYLHEYWQKRFSSMDYTFKYDYQNFAHDKVGNPLMFAGELEAEYQVKDYLRIYAGAKYVQVFGSDNKMGYEYFPFENELTVKLGLTFVY